MKKTMLSLIILSAVLFLLSCPAVFNPDPFGRWNPADPDYEAATDPDVVVVVTVTRTDSGTQEAAWSWTCNVPGAAFRHAVNRDDSFTFTNESFNETTTASASAENGDGTWYCYVQATTAGGALSAIEMASAVLSADTTGPDCTLRLIKPEAGYYTGARSTVNVNLKWTVDDTTDVAKFVVRFLDGPDPGTATVKETVDNIEASATSCAANLIGTDPYYGCWQVGAADAAGNITWSAARRIRVGITANDVNGDGYADLLVGAPVTVNGGFSQAGLWSRYYGKADAGLTHEYSFPGNANSQRAGRSVSIFGDYDGDGTDDFAVVNTYNAGIVDVFLSSSGGYPDTATFHIERPLIEFGSAIAGGDFNGDGFDDLAIGARAAGTNYEGIVYIYWGNAARTFNQYSATFNPAAQSVYLGSALAAGDVNNDGYDDLIAAGPGDLSSQGGRVYIFLGSSSPDFSSADVTLLRASYTLFGNSVACGDVNGDGYSDIIVGEPSYDSGTSNIGRIHLFMGGESISTTASQTRIGESVGEFCLGASVACGDVTGDGKAEVFAGAPGYGGGSDWGLVYYFNGPPTLASYSGYISTATGAYHEGQTVRVAGDLNNDGFNDLVIAMPFYNTSVGRIKGIYGESVLSTAEDFFLAPSTGTQNYFGGSNFDTDSIQGLSGF